MSRTSLLLWARESNRRQQPGSRPGCMHCRKRYLARCAHCCLPPCVASLSGVKLVWGAHAPHGHRIDVRSRALSGKSWVGAIGGHTVPPHQCCLRPPFCALCRLLVHYGCCLAAGWVQWPKGGCCEGLECCSVSRTDFTESSDNICRWAQEGCQSIGFRTGSQTCLHS